MSLFKFIKDAGERLFGSGEAQAATPAAGAPAARPDPAAANASAAAAIKTYIEKMQLAPADLAVAFDGATATVTVSGTAPDQATRERILLAAGNVRGVADVDDRMQVASPAPEARFHTVVCAATPCRQSPRPTTATPTAIRQSSKPTSPCSATRTRSTPGRCCAFPRSTEHPQRASSHCAATAAASSVNAPSRMAAATSSTSSRTNSATSPSLLLGTKSSATTR